MGLKGIFFLPHVRRGKKKLYSALEKPLEFLCL